MGAVGSTCHHRREDFNTAQALLQSRAPKPVAPRIVNTPTLLAGVARCGHCGAALIQNTGKGGKYRYYCCSRRLKEGITACIGLRMPMDKLDDIVMRELAKQILQPDRLKAMLQSYLKTALDREGRNKEHLRQLRTDQKETEAAIARLLELVEKGLMDAEDPAMRERLVNLRFRRDELVKQIADLHRRISSAEPAITPAKIEKFARLLRDKLRTGSGDLKQAYVRLLLNEVRVDDGGIRISGSKAVLARGAAEGLDKPASAVLSFVQEWRTRRDSNSRPLPSEGSALSS